MRDVRLRLIIVVIRDKILDRVFREKLLELAAQLRRKGLIVRQNKCRPVDAGDDVCHREGLAGAGDAEQHLFVYSVLNACHKAVYRFRLVPRRLIRRYKLEFIHSCLQS